jgi:hypothetical protein
MTTTNFGKKIGGAILGVVVLFGVGMISSSTAQAQYPTYNQRQQDRNRGRGDDRNDRNRGRDNDRWNDNGDRRNDGYRNYGGTFELRQTALNAGFNEGLKEGRKDRSHGDRYDYRDEGAYQRATNDYSGRLGDRGIYQRYFRDAFGNGYKAGYQGY